MPYRALGRTGEQVSLIGLGGHHIGTQKDEADSIRLVHAALDGGINFLDNCWDYNEGQSEIRMGKALAGGRRDKAFLMTKIDGRTKESAARQIDESLKRLQTDRVDLMQIHEVIRMEDPDRIFGRNGTMEALLEAKQAGKIRFIGFTGHKDPIVHQRLIEVARKNNFTFDAAQMPINVMDANFRSFARDNVPTLLREGTAVLGMKTFGGGPVLRYVRANNVATPIELLHYSMSQPVSSVITGCDSMPILEQALQAARTFQPMPPAQQAMLIEKVRSAALDGRYERFKTSDVFDGTAKNPQWLR
jgi:aryl-alcohol dehydrogenase-like predicted oxidoreductase